MQLYKLLVLFGLAGFLEAEIVNIKRDVKHIENTYLADLPQTDVDATLSRSFLECINTCNVISNCLSTFYKDSVCWLVKGTVSCSTPSCFQVKNETTKAYIELYAVSNKTNAVRICKGNIRWTEYGTCVVKYEILSGLNKHNKCLESGKLAVLRKMRHSS